MTDEQTQTQTHEVKPKFLVTVELTTIVRVRFHILFFFVHSAFRHLSHHTLWKLSSGFVVFFSVSRNLNFRFV